MFADIKLVALHGRPVTRRRLVEPIAEAWNSPDGVQSQLVAIEIVQHDHIERRRSRALLLIAAHVNIVVIVPSVGSLCTIAG